VPSPFDLTGHVAVVTGGGSGIGLGMADALAEAGADLAIWARDVDRLEASAEQLRAHGRRVATIGCDVSDEAAVEAAMASTLEQLGKVDSMFANSGTGGKARSFLQMELEEFRRVLAVNLDGTFLCFRAAARHMVERGEGGRLVATSSMVERFGQPAGEHYAASKAGVSAMVRSLAVELARHRITANSILPGWIETPMTAGAVGWERFEDRVIGRVPLRRWGQPTDFGAVAVYLASPASGFHTGDTLMLDGGYSIY
jgi:NAD(P)-dependent dehydrogenase (short-subunit alcohol dehydrogenase family)